MLESLRERVEPGPSDRRGTPCLFSDRLGSASPNDTNSYGEVWIMGQIVPDLGIWVLSKTFVGLSQKRWGIGTLIGQGKVLISHDSSRFSKLGSHRLWQKRTPLCGALLAEKSSLSPAFPHKSLPVSPAKPASACWRMKTGKARREARKSPSHEGYIPRGRLSELVPLFCHGAARGTQDPLFPLSGRRRLLQAPMLHPQVKLPFVLLM